MKESGIMSADILSLPSLEAVELIPDESKRIAQLLTIVQQIARIPESATKDQHEVQNKKLRGEWALSLSRNANVVKHPVACSLLLEATVSLPGIAEEVMRQILEHPAFPVEARQAIFDSGFELEGEQKEEPPFMPANVKRGPSAKARRGPLAKAKRGPSAKAERDPSAKAERDPSAKAERGLSIVVDCLHSYGDGLYLTPREHIQTNHFGSDVAGSRVTAWDDFDEMWEEIAPAVEGLCNNDGSTQVIELEFPEDIGTHGLIRLEQAPPETIGMEFRNGHPSLYCNAEGLQFPTRQLTVVLGPSEIKPGEVSNYQGHNLPCVLYTVYPGEPASPFPTWSTEDLPLLRSSTQASLELLQMGQVEEAKAILFKAYSQLDGTGEAALFWSRHLLLR